MTAEDGGTVELSLEDLRSVAAYAAACARTVLPIFETAHPTDLRPRAALEAADRFVDGAPRTNLQRKTALDANRAAADATTEAARQAARAAGHAAAAAYLHPLAKSTQVGHILGAAANAAYAAELEARGDTAIGDARIADAFDLATPTLLDVLNRYPSAPTGKNRAAHLMSELDAALRSRWERHPSSASSTVPRAARG